jgi:hypothetical protein
MLASVDKKCPVVINRHPVWSSDTSDRNFSRPLGRRRTALRFKQEPSGNIKITLEDSAVMSKYSDQEKAALPKF